MSVMDCCNYLHYKHSYYRPQFYDNGFYNRDYYGHPYQSHYPTSNYYTHQWPSSASFSDYVYNPKEARIRKAMREAYREQTAGAAPTSSPRGGRRSQSWVNTHEDHLIMTPPPEMGSQMCSNPIFPGHSSTGQFMPPMNAYTKLVHFLPSSGWLQDSPTYIQHNPMAELQQHQAHMWHQYQEPVRPCQDATYMVNPHTTQYPETGENDLVPHKKCKSQMAVDEIIPRPKIDKEIRIKQEKMDESNTQMLKNIENVTSRTDAAFLPTAEETVVVQNPFDRDDEMKLKKPTIPLTQRNGNRQSIKALPDFNEAFGSTERGRFQSPPDPRLAPNKSYLDCLFFNDGVKFYDYHV